MLGAKTAEEEYELLQQEMHDLEEAAEEEAELLQQDMHDLEKDEESLQQDLASDTEIDEELVLPQQQPLEPKRPPSAYFLFVSEKRADVLKTIEKAAMADVARKVTDMRQKLEPDIKEEYEKRALSMKIKYEEQMEAYKDSEGYLYHQFVF